MQCQQSLLWTPLGCHHPTPLPSGGGARSHFPGVWGFPSGMFPCQELNPSLSSNPCVPHSSSAQSLTTARGGGLNSCLHRDLSHCSQILYPLYHSGNSSSFSDLTVCPLPPLDLSTLDDIKQFLPVKDEEIGIVPLTPVLVLLCMSLYYFYFMDPEVSMPEFKSHLCTSWPRYLGESPHQQMPQSLRL